jgi:hypothetical protein
MICSRICGGRTIITDIPLNDIFQWRQIPDRVEKELEYTDLGSQVLRGVVKTATETIDAGRCWSGTLKLEDFAHDDNGTVCSNRAATDYPNPGRIRKNLQDLAASIESHFSVNGKFPAYLQNLIKKLRRSTVVWDQTVRRHRLDWVYMLVLLSHFAGLPSMCRANVVYQLKVYFDKLPERQQKLFKKALRRCSLKVNWLELVSTNPVVQITFLNGTYGDSPVSPFFLSRNYFSHSYQNSWVSLYKMRCIYL